MAITVISAYEAMGVPEVWIYRNRKLTIYLLKAGTYREVDFSPTLPHLTLITLIPQLIQPAIEQGMSRMLRELRTR